MIHGWLVVLAGAMTGLVVGLTGVGGGALMTPMLLLVFGVAPVTAVGTDLWFAALTKIVAVPMHQGRGAIDWQVVRRLWVGSLPAALITVGLLKSGLIGMHHPAFLKLAIAFAVLLTALGMLLRRAPKAIEPGQSIHGVQNESRSRMTLTILAGVLLGALVTLTSVGAGALGAVFLTFLYPGRFTPSRLVATDLVHAIPLALFAGVGHLLVGNVDGRLLALLLCGSVPSVLIGAKLSHRIPQGVLRWMIAVVLLMVGLKLMASN